MMKSLFSDGDQNTVFDLLPKDFPTVNAIQAVQVATFAIVGGDQNKQHFCSLVKTTTQLTFSFGLSKLSLAAIKTAFDDLEKKEIITFDGFKYVLAPRYSAKLSQRASANHEFMTALWAALKDGYTWHVSNQQKRYCYITKKNKLGDKKLSLFGDSGCINTLLDIIQDQNDLFYADNAHLKTFEDYNAQSVFTILPLFFPTNDQMVEHSIKWFADLDSSHKGHTFFSFISYLALYALPSQIDQAIALYLEDAGEQFQALENAGFVADMLRGDWAAARQKGAALKDFLNEYHGNKKKEMPFIVGGFYSILLFFSDAPLEQKHALTYLRASKKQCKEWGVEHAFASELINLLLRFFDAKQKGESYHLPGEYRNPFLVNVWTNIILAWDGKNEKISLLKDEHVSRSTRLTLEQEAYKVLASGKKDWTATDQVSKKAGMKPLCRMVEPDPDWLEMLKVFEVQASTPKAAPQEKKERLVWRVDFEKNEIIPYNQKHQRQGWSKGRNIALRTLYSKTPAYATDIDVQIINNLKREDGWYGVEYYWNVPKCFELMVNHPLLFTIDEPMLPVVLKGEEVTFVVKEKKDEVQVSLSADLDTLIVKESPRNYKYMEWDKGVLQMAKQMAGKGLNHIKFPQEAKDRVRKALTEYSQRISIKGDFDDPNLIKKNGKTDPLVRITPLGDSMNVTVLIKPLSEIDLTFVPAVGNATIITRTKSGERLRIKRSLKKEQAALNTLKESIPTLAGMEENEMMLDDELDTLNFLSEMREFAPKVEMQWPKGETLRVGKVVSMGDLNVNVKSGIDWFELSGKVALDKEKVMDIQQLMEASGGGSKAFIKLNDKVYIKLKKDLQKRLAELSAIGENKKGSLQVHRLGAESLSGIVEEAGKSRTDKGWKDNRKKTEALRNFVPQQPNNLQAELRPYQKEGYNWLSRLYAWEVGACLADDMGLGKTIQAIALMLQHAGEGPALVVAPSSVCPNWGKELRRFAPALNCHALSLQDREKTIENLKAFDVLVVSYGITQSNPNLLAKKEWNIAVLDEAHAIKNSNSMRSKAAMKLKAKFKLITTGTPIQNHIGELWNLFQFINPGFLGNNESFNSRFVNGSSAQEIAQKRKALNRYIAPFILRRNKADVLDDLPGKTEITLNVEQTEDEKALYEVLRRKAIESIETEESNSGAVHMKILAQISKLRLASCNARLVDADQQMKSSKMKTLERLVDDLLEAKHKALIFSQFTKHLALIKEMLDAKKITYQYLDGSSTSKAREKAIINFQSGKSDLFLISLKAGGVGLNLTAADYVIHMDPWWNPAIEDQASDRAHRIGQIRPVTVYRLVAEGTIEEKIIKLHHEKRSLADQLLAETDKSAKISSAELFELMK